MPQLDVFSFSNTSRDISISFSFLRFLQYTPLTSKNFFNFSMVTLKKKKKKKEKRKKKKEKRKRKKKKEKRKRKKKERK